MGNEGRYAFYRTHNVNCRKIAVRHGWRPYYGNDGKACHDRAILLVRHYLESYAREMRGYGAMSRVGVYCENVKAFDEFEGEKIVVRYEDLLSKELIGQRQIAEFLGAEFDDSNFDVERESAVSVEWYNRLKRTNGGARTKDYGDLTCNTAGVPEVEKRIVKRVVRRSLSSVQIARYMTQDIRAIAADGDISVCGAPLSVEEANIAARVGQYEFDVMIDGEWQHVVSDCGEWVEVGHGWVAEDCRPSGCRYITPSGRSIRVY